MKLRTGRVLTARADACPDHRRPAQGFSLLLRLLLGSWTAPLYLVGVSVLVVAAPLGVTVYVFQDLLGYGELAFFVPIAAAILAIGLLLDTMVARTLLIPALVSLFGRG